MRDWPNEDEAASMRLTMREQKVKIAHLKAHQDETAKAWTKLTESQEQEIEELRALVKELADDLEYEVEGHYTGIKDHPAMKPKYERDMENVYKARRALANEQE